MSRRSFVALLNKAPPGFLITCLLASFILSVLYTRGWFQEDVLDTFTCAGQAILNGADPYRTEPLRTCELQKSGGTRFNNSGAVEPAPLPAYALVPFELLSIVSKKLAHAIFPALLLTAVILTCLAIAKLTSFSFPGLMLIFIPTTYLNTVYGENTLFAVAGVALAGLALARKRYTLAALAVACSMVQPHIGLASCVALFLWVPETRRTLTVCAVVAAVLSIATIGVERNVEYFRDVLPGQALAEVYADDQYSLTRMLFWFGFSPASAIRLGTISYVIMAVFGIWLSKKLSDVLKAPEFMALLPPVAVLLGGTFVHDIQMSLAIPCAIILAHHSEARKWMSWFAIPLIATILGHHWRWFFYLAPFLAAAFIARRSRSRTVVTSWCAAGAIVIGVLFSSSFFRQPPSPAATPMPTELLDGGRIASDAWGAYLRSGDTPPGASVVEWIERIPNWLGLICILIVATGQLCRRKQIAHGSKI